jgi:hypothetical protein
MTIERYYCLLESGTRSLMNNVTVFIVRPDTVYKLCICYICVFSLIFEDCPGFTSSGAINSTINADNWESTACISFLVVMFPLHHRPEVESLSIQMPPC